MAILLEAKKLVVAVGKADRRGHGSRTEAGSTDRRWDGEDLCWLSAPLGVLQSARPIALIRGYSLSALRAVGRAL